ncbi:MAG: hypothetical protein AAGF20_00780 [Pseudomonadota bacterium]
MSDVRERLAKILEYFDRDTLTERTRWEAIEQAWYELGRSQLGQSMRLVDADGFIASLKASGLTIEQDWQGIESAPKDGTNILIDSNDYERPDVVFWDAAYAEGGFYRNDDTAWVTSGGEQLSVEPTHWKPLPATPAAQEEG